MCLKAIQLIIASDNASLITTTASGVQTTNPDLWSDPSQVPLYAYKPFGDIFVTVGAASTQIANVIVYKLGQNLEKSSGELSLIGDGIESSDVKSEGLVSNDPGAETMYLDFVLRLPESKQNWDKIINSELRLRYILDATWREHRKVSPWVVNLGDNTCDKYLRLRWMRYLVPPNAKEIWSRYSVVYTRAVPK